MGKIRTRTLGVEEEEKKQKEEQKKKATEKKLAKKAEKVESAEVTPAKKEVKAKETKPKTTKLTIHVRGKKYQEAKKLVDTKKTHSLVEAVNLLKKIKSNKFDESVELHINVVETGLKGEVELPHSTGKTVRITVVNDEVLSNLEKGKIDFDLLVTHPSFMPKLARFAKILGPKGLMPNPKAGTISTSPEEVVKKFAKGNLRWKTEPKFPLVHQMIGKISFDEKAIIENAKKFIESVGVAHITKVVIKTTMSPAVRIDVEKI